MIIKTDRPKNEYQEQSEKGNIAQEMQMALKYVRCLTSLSREAYSCTTIPLFTHQVAKMYKLDNAPLGGLWGSTRTC